MVFRCYTERKDGFTIEGNSLLKELRDVVGIEGITSVRVLNRYDIEGIDRDVYEQIRSTIFSEPQTDVCYDESYPARGDTYTLISEPLPGQFDQRADSAAQCVQMLTLAERPIVRTAQVHEISGSIEAADIEKIISCLINPVESRQATSDKPETLAAKVPEIVPDGAVEGFLTLDDAGLLGIIEKFGLAMDFDDISFLRDWFRDREGRDPELLELRVLDTYWSDHCRHTTFGTILDEIEIEDAEVKKAFNRYIEIREDIYGEAAKTRPVTLMDMATIGAKYLKKQGLLANLDESEEINACSIKIKAKIGGELQDWLLMFKNETHNHPTEIEPFGGAATCLGGAIRDPLSGRSYVYQAMRVTGSGDPRAPYEDTLPGKLPQRKLTTTAARGYSSYGNQIGLATGLVHEVYHPGYVAKRMEVGAVVGAAPIENVIRERPQDGDIILLIGGRTGRDGIGGATGSSKTHDLTSLTESSSEVQKGNAPEEHKLQRLFRNPEAARMIRRCNDFGAGGVSVAIGELSDGLDMNLDAVRKKYDGLTPLETAISESQERMAVVVAPSDAASFIKLADAENLECYKVARVTSSERMVMRSAGKVVCDLSRKLLNSNGAEKYAAASIPELAKYSGAKFEGTPAERLHSIMADLRFASQRGLTEMFDSSIGTGSVLSPFGGKSGKAPADVMAALIPAQNGDSSTASVMAFGFDPYHMEQNPYAGAMASVITSAAKLAAAGCDPDSIYFSFQEYFERLTTREKWGKPFSALLGALEAQTRLQAAAIGGKDSMSGSFMDLHVPPTLISFAVSTCDAAEIITSDFQFSDMGVCLLPAGDTPEETKEMWRALHYHRNSIVSARAVSSAGPLETIAKMTLGNMIGFEAWPELDHEALFEYAPGSIIVETNNPIPGALPLGRTIFMPELRLFGENVNLAELTKIWEAPLESVFPTTADAPGTAVTVMSEKPRIIFAEKKFSAPRAVIPAFPGTNCEYDTAMAVSRAGGIPRTIVIRNLTSEALRESISELEAAIRSAQMIIIPGGFSGGDEPDGSAKFITSLFRSPGITDAVEDLLYNRDGLMLGICNGFQALVKLGLVPFGHIRSMDADCPTLTFNTIGRHQAKYVKTKVSSVMSPWLSKASLGEIHSIPISHGEGRFVATDDMIASFADAGQIAAQYVDGNGMASMDCSYNPNGSVCAIEALSSPDGRVLGKMGHSERNGKYVGVNIAGEKFQPIFESGVGYYM